MSGTWPGKVGDVEPRQQQLEALRAVAVLRQRGGRHHGQAAVIAIAWHAGDDLAHGSMGSNQCTLRSCARAAGACSGAQVSALGHRDRGLHKVRWLLFSPFRVASGLAAIPSISIA